MAHVFAVLISNTFFMRFTTVLILMIVFITKASAQCKPYVSEDKFTKAKQIFYGGFLDESSLIGDKKTDITFYVGTTNDSLCSVVQVLKYVDKENERDIDEAMELLKIKVGQQTFLVLESGDVVKVKALYETKISKTKSLLGSSFTISMQATCSLTKQDLAMLASSKITAFRIELANTVPMEGKCKDKKASKLLAQFKCANTDLPVLKH